MPTSGWLKAGIAAFIDGVSGVSGRIIMPLPHNKPTDYEYNASFTAGEWLISLLIISLFASSSSRLLAAHNRKREKTLICH